MSRPQPLAQPGLFDPQPKVEKPAPAAHFLESFDLFGDESDPDGLRYYQRDAVDAALRSLRENRSALLVMATGTGKTQCAGAMCTAMKGRVLFIAHRKELIEQSVKKLHEMTGELVEIEMAEWKAEGARIVVASVQTLSRGTRLERWSPNGFDLVIVDEAHHAVAESYKKILDFFGSAKVLGLTATPDRQDERPLGEVFDDVPYKHDIADAIRGGWLVPIKADQILVRDIELTEVETMGSRGDFKVGQLDDAVKKGVGSIVEHTLRLSPDGRGLAFFPGVMSAAYAAEVFNEAVPDSAAFISGETPRDERESIIRRFRKGHIQWLCNCQIATEGFDVPEVDTIILGRPTKSRALYAQMVGRGTRPILADILGLDARDQADERRARIAAGKKPHVRVLDFKGVCGEHKLVCPTDLLGEDESDEVLERARKIAKQSEHDEHTEGEDPLETIALAKAELAELKAIAQRTRVTSKADVFEVDVFAGYGVSLEETDSVDMRFGAKMATTAQVEALRKAGISEGVLEGLTKRRASKLFDALQARRDKDLATLKQLRTLRKSIAVDPERITFKRATAGITYLRETRWKGGSRQGTYNPATLERILYGES